MKKLVLLVIPVLLLAASDWKAPKEAAEKKNPVAASPASLKEAKALYEKECSMCHGSKGDGKGEAAASLNKPATNFTDAAAMADETDGALFYKISEGRMPMLTFKGKLSEEQRWSLVNYIHTFAKKGGGAKKK
jgi:mono/diheme cytochrome c family protein